MDLVSAAEKLTKRKDADQVECYIVESESINLNSVGKNIEKRNINYDAGVAIRVIKDKRMGFQYFMDPKFADTAFDNAIKLSKFYKTADYEFPNNKIIKVDGLNSKKIENMQIPEVYDILKNTIDVVYENGAEVIMSDLILEKSKSRIINSNGLDAEDKETGMYFEISSQCNGGTDSEAFAARDVFDPAPIAKKSAEYSKLMQKPIKLEKMTTDLIFNTRAIYNLLLEMFLPMTSGEMARRKLSLLQDKEGKMVLPESVTISEKMNAPGCWGSASFDGDGFAASEKTIFKNGIFNQFLYNMDIAAKAGKKSTGNAMRSGYRSPPHLSFSNIFVNAGEGFEIEKGIFVHDFMGSHTLDPITGDFSILFDVAFLMEKGEIKSSIRQAMLSSNIFEIFKKLKAIDTKTNTFMNLSTPNFLFSKVFVSGS